VPLGDRAVGTIKSQSRKRTHLTEYVTIGNILFMTGEELKTLRAKLGLTQDELGKRLGVARVTVTRWEIGLRRVPELAARLVQHVARAVRAGQKKRKRA
jgi:DNA-binding transcriptional regulator YiaG